MLDKKNVSKIIETNPRIDASAIQRSRDIAKKLAEAGLEVGSYRIEPALGGELLKKARASTRVKHQQKRP